jgi:hypothetical protein
MEMSLSESRTFSIFHFPQSFDRASGFVSKLWPAVFYLMHSLFRKMDMHPRELVDHILSGPKELLLDFPLRFRRRTRLQHVRFQLVSASPTI